MTVYQITYTLHDPGQEYEDLHDAIKAYGDYTHILDACWLIDADDTSTKEIRDNLKSYIDWNDKILVTKKATSGRTWSTTFSNDSTDWLHDH